MYTYRWQEPHTRSGGLKQCAPLGTDPISNEQLFEWTHVCECSCGRLLIGQATVSARQAQWEMWTAHHFHKDLANARQSAEYNGTWWIKTEQENMK